jgi:putative flippase GtrA
MSGSKTGPARRRILRSPRRIATLLRYCAVSAVATGTSLMTLGVLVGVLGANATLANVVATAIGTVPSFELNRRWVWASQCRRSMTRQVLPFCVLAFAGLVLAVRVAAAQTASLSRGWHTLAVELANVAAYGTLWVLQFVILDRALFKPADPPSSSTVAERSLELVGAGAPGDPGPASPHPDQ